MSPLAGASVFSGRPDPTWPLDAATVEQVRAVWAGLAPSDRPPATPPPLGYRGCWVRLPDGAEWHAYGDVVTHDGERRHDPDRSFERVVLRSAPPGTLPDRVVP